MYKMRQLTPLNLKKKQIPISSQTKACYRTAFLQYAHLAEVKKPFESKFYIHYPKIMD